MNTQEIIRHYLSIYLYIYISIYIYLYIYISISISEYANATCHTVTGIDPHGNWLSSSLRPHVCRRGPSAHRGEAGTVKNPGGFSHVFFRWKLWKHRFFFSMNIGLSWFIKVYYLNIMGWVIIILWQWPFGWSRNFKAHILWALISGGSL